METLKIRLFLLFIMSGCNSTKVTTIEPIIPQPIKPEKNIQDYASEAYPIRNWDPRYSEIIKLLLSTYQVKFPCNAELTLKGIINAESGFNNASYYMEPAPLNKYSIGFFQLSLSDAKYYGCLFKTEKEIENPVYNLDCAIKIMHKLQTKYPTLSFYEAQGKYWSVLRWNKYSVWAGKTQSGWERVRKYWANAGCTVK